MSLPLFAVLLVASANGGAGPPVPSECRAVDVPKRLPRTVDLIDSTGLTVAIAGATLTESPAIRLGVAFPRPSGAPEAWVIDSGGTSEAQARLATLAQAALRPNGAAPGTTLRIYLRVATTIQVRVERSILCAPVPLDSASGSQPAYQVGEGDGKAPRHTWKSGVRQWIGADGLVLDARLQPGSGRRDVDRLVLEPVFARRWRPATLDGRPVSVWLENGRAELVP